MHDLGIDVRADGRKLRGSHVDKVPYLVGLSGFCDKLVNCSVLRVNGICRTVACNGSTHADLLHIAMNVGVAEFRDRRSCLQINAYCSCFGSHILAGDDRRIVIQFCANLRGFRPHTEISSVKFNAHIAVSRNRSRYGVSQTCADFAHGIAGRDVAGLELVREVSNVSGCNILADHRGCALEVQSGVSKLHHKFVSLLILCYVTCFPGLEIALAPPPFANCSAAINAEDFSFVLSKNGDGDGFPFFHFAPCVAPTPQMI